MENKIHILYIEDDAIDRLAFKKYAEQNPSNYIFDLVGTAQEALDRLSRKQFDIIVTDYNLKQLKAIDMIEQFGTTPFIIMTGQGNEEIAIAALKAGASDYIIKDPLSKYLKSVYISIERTLKSRQQEIELTRYREHLEEIIIEKTKELEKTNKLFKQLIENLPVMVFQLSIKGDDEIAFQYASSGATQLFNRTPDEIIKSPNDFFSLFHNDDRIVFEMRLVKSTKTMKPWNLELRANIDLERRWFQSFCKPEIDRTGTTIVYGVFVESTDYKLAEEKVSLYQTQLRQLVSQLSNVEERERRKIATDLHDRIGQSLALAKLKLKSTQNKFATHEVASDLDDIVQMVQTAITDTRGLISDLSPSVLYELGIVAAVEWLSEKLSKQHKIQINIKTHKLPKLDNDDLKAFVYRVSHELLINAIKHAQATSIEVSFDANFAETSLCVKDNGIGFDTKKLTGNDTSKDCFGLFSIKERLNYFGGKLEIVSQPNQGTSVTVTVLNRLVPTVNDEKD